MKTFESFEKFGKKSKTALKVVQTKNAVMYTRVSGKEQFDTNLSLETQKKTIEGYAEKHGLDIVSSFGGTYESAKTDGRKEFMRMLEFIKKSRRKISTILVFKMTRFSRTGGKQLQLWMK